MKNLNYICISEDNNNEIYKKVESLFNNFCLSKKLKRTHSFINEFKEVFNKEDKSTIIKLFTSEYLYRARLIKNEKDDCIGTSELFKGFDETNSFVPPELICNSGRLNYEHLPYLYAANNEHTAIVEIRPQLNQKVSVAKIQINKELDLLNLTKSCNPKEANYKQEAFIDIISEALYTPINDDEKGKYINTQIIADVVKEMGYDGIAHLSSMDKDGMNYCIFNYENCKPISSEIYIPKRVEMRCLIDGSTKYIQGQCMEYGAMYCSKEWQKCPHAGNPQNNEQSHNKSK